MSGSDSSRKPTLASIRIEREMKSLVTRESRVIDLLKRDLVMRSQEVDDLRFELDAALSVNEALRESTSWRITKPLRRLRGKN